MTSRFTQTEKWDDKWFRQLSPNAKVLYWYIWDKCNIAGFWEIDLDGAAFHTKISTKSIGRVFEELARGFLAKGNYVWVRKFLYHQRNLPLNPNNPAHKGILKIIDEFKSIFPTVLDEIKNQLTKELKKEASKGLSSLTSKSKGKGKGKGKGKYTTDFEIFWKAYPRGDEKKDAFGEWQKLNPDEKLRETISNAVEQQKKTGCLKDPQYAPYAVRWLKKARWTDEVKGVDSPKKPTAAETLKRLESKGLL